MTPASDVGKIMLFQTLLASFNTARVLFEDYNYISTTTIITSTTITNTFTTTTNITTTTTTIAFNNTTNTFSTTRTNIEWDV